MEPQQLSREAQIERDEKNFRLLLRQLTDIQAQADKIISGENSRITIKEFALYSLAMKEYIERRVPDRSMREHARRIPELYYIRLWHVILLPMFLLELYRDYYLLPQTREIRNKYSILEFLIRRLG